MTYLALILLLVLALVALRLWSKRRRRAALLARPLTDDQRRLVAARVPLTRHLPGALRPRFEGRINLFLDQITFLGGEGVEVTEEMRLTIAAQACLLVAGSEAWYDSLRTVLVYPGAFRSRLSTQEGFVVTERETVRLGESWPRGPVVLSWPDSVAGAADAHDGHNLVLHEFAHQIDGLKGRTDGAPLLARGQSEALWDRVFLEAYRRHRAAVEHGHPTVIDPYGAENPQEYLAVTIELFFERPRALSHAEPDVYAQLAHLLNLDPAQWDGQG